MKKYANFEKNANPLQFYLDNTCYVQIWIEIRISTDINKIEKLDEFELFCLSYIYGFLGFKYTQKQLYYPHTFRLIKIPFTLIGDRPSRPARARLSVGGAEV